jgi:DNA modification methylase
LISRPSLKLSVGDNVDVLRREVADNSIQLTVTSPPYDNLRTYNGFTWDFTTLAKELYRVTKPGGIVVWVVSDATINGSETGSSFKQALGFKDVGFNLHDTMIWYKEEFNAAGSLRVRYASTFEYMFVLSKGSPSIFNPIKDRPNKCAGNKMTGTKRQPDGTIVELPWLQGKTVADFGQRHNVWNCGPEKSKAVTKHHPAVFPERLALDHILSWSNPGDTILDPFLGSGTTGKMALLNGRNFIGCDISSEYVTQAKKRIIWIP